MTLSDQVRATARSILQCAAERIGPADRWVQGTMAVDPDGAHRTPTDPRACRWCALGALHRAVLDHTTPDGGQILWIRRAKEAAMHALADAMRARIPSHLWTGSLRPGGYAPEAVAYINDHHRTDHEAVRADFARAIASLD